MRKSGMSMLKFQGVRVMLVKGCLEKAERYETNEPEHRATNPTTKHRRPRRGAAGGGFVANARIVRRNSAAFSRQALER
jgi:hypothetical protein